MRQQSLSHVWRGCGGFVWLVGGRVGLVGVEWVDRVG